MGTTPLCDIFSCVDFFSMNIDGASIRYGLGSRVLIWHKIRLGLWPGNQNSHRARTQPNEGNNPRIRPKGVGVMTVMSSQNGNFADLLKKVALQSLSSEMLSEVFSRSLNTFGFAF